MHPVPGRAPDIALPVDPEPVGQPGIDGGEDLGRAQPVAPDRIDLQDRRHRRIVARPRLGDVKPAFVGREGKPVRLGEILGHRLDGAGAGDAINPAVGLFGFRLIALVIRQDPVGRVREPDRPVRLHHHVVGRIQPPPVIGIGQRGAAPVGFGPDHRPRAVLAGHQPSLGVAGVAVGIVPAAAEHSQMAVRGPAQDLVVGDVREQQRLEGREPDRPFGPAEAGGQPFQPRRGLDQRPEATVAQVIEHVGCGRGLGHGRASLPLAAATMAMMMTPVMIRRTPAPRP